MPHSGRPFFAFIALITLTAGALASATGPTMAQSGPSAPLEGMRGWSVGDWWHYTKQPTNEELAQTEGDYKLKVMGPETITQSMYNASIHDPAWERHATWHVKVWANQSANTQFGLTAVKTLQDRYYRRDDLAMAANDARSTFTFIDSPENDQSQGRDHEMFPPQVEMVWPFTVGDMWRIRVHQRNFDPGGDCDREGRPSCNSISNKLDTMEVLAKEKVTLRVNGVRETFDTYRIKVIDETGVEDPQNNPDGRKYEIWWYAPRVCNIVKKEEWKADHERRFVHTLTGYACKGAPQPNPSYAIYDYQNFSATRFHGELYDGDPLLHLFKDGQGETVGAGGERVSGGFQIFNGTPGPGAAVAIAALALAGVAFGRRNRSR